MMLPPAPLDDQERRVWGDLHGLYPRTSPLDAWGHAQRMANHLREYTACVVWAVQNGLQPAMSHKHLAPCNVGMFYYGIAPWRADGSVNPWGVSPGAMLSNGVETERKIPEFTGMEPMRPEDERPRWRGDAKKPVGLPKGR
jgi:hypothetical protein